jgi:hypothetical protein
VTISASDLTTIQVESCSGFTYNQINALNDFAIPGFTGDQLVAINITAIPGFTFTHVGNFSGEACRKITGDFFQYYF